MVDLPQLKLVRLDLRSLQLMSPKRVAMLALLAFTTLPLLLLPAVRAQPAPVAPATAAAMPSAETTQPAVALHYGAQPPIDALRAFDWVVLEPAHAGDPTRLPAPTRWFAYTSVGELDSTSRFAAVMPSTWLRGDNPAWGSRLVDHAAAGWPEFFAAQVIGPLWAQGWRGFFLDTLDSHRLFARTPQEQRAQEDALVAMVELLHQRYPDIQLIFNRGFEILPRLKGRVHGVAAESLFRGWDQAARRYVEVPENDRRWLQGELERVRREHGVPVVAIDYAPPADRALARATAQQIRAAGFIPWVSNGALTSLGVGNLESEPRRVLLLTDPAPGTDMQNSGAYRFLALPLHWLGYVIEARDIRDVRTPLPELDPGRHAAIITWFSQQVASMNPQYARWLKRQRDNGLRLVLLEQPGLNLDATVMRDLGLVSVRARGPVQITQRPPWVGFETPPPQAAPPDVALLFNGTGDGTGERLRLRTGDGTLVDAAAITPWGGFALAPFVVRPPMLASMARWVIDPITFLRSALGNPQFPVPDVTTEAGRRLLFVHIDGDGFVSRAERPGSPFAGEVLLTDVLQQRRIPHTVSVIQGEIAGNGMFAQLAPTLEDIARRIFAQPHVEIASHSFSHPYSWRKLAQGTREGAGDARPLNLMLPGYEFNLQAEVPGSVQYIDTKLAPAGKRTRVFLWTGDTVPTQEAVALADATGVLNMNGGDTLITRSEPTLTEASGLGLLRGPALQVFAPMQNENLYTSNWTEHFYGFERVIETFELTGRPLRLKPINIYYHVYSATKAASLTALNRVYDWAGQQSTVPVYASDYIRKVVDFHALAIARDWRSREPAWRVRSEGALRTLRLAPDTAVALGASSNVAGVAPGPRARYVHLAGSDARVNYGSEARTPVHVVSAAGWISDLTRSDRSLSFTLNSYTAPTFTLAQAERCRVRIDGQDSAALSVAREHGGITTTYEPKRSEPGKQPAPPNAPRQHLVDVRCA
jgi:hypothetical protein